MVRFRGAKLSLRGFVCFFKKKTHDFLLQVHKIYTDNDKKQQAMVLLKPVSSMQQWAHFKHVKHLPYKFIYIINSLSDSFALLKYKTISNHVE